MPQAPPRRANPHWNRRERSREAEDWHDAYNTTAWRRYRLAFLAEHALCEECLKEGRFTPATVVDHEKPWKGDMVLFWDEGNHRAKCASCHSKKTASADGGFGNRRKA